jgi:hypothetical protein
VVSNLIFTFRIASIGGLVKIIDKDFRRNIWVGKTVFYTGSKTPDSAEGRLQVPVLWHTSY